MRKFTKSLMVLAMLCVAGTAGAQTVESDLTADMFKTWSTTDGNASVTGDATIDFNVGNEISNGGVLCGTSSVDGFVYADLSEYTKIVFTGTPAEGQSSFQLRVLYNREGKSGANGEKNPTITTENPTVELNIADLGLSYFHLVAVKAGWGQTGTVTSIKLVKPTDPYEVPKATLKTSIDKGKLQNSFAKTEASWNALQDAITAGEAEYANPTSADALNAATLAIENAIAGLELLAGYTSLTATMFKVHASTAIDAAITGNAGCSYVINAASDLPYGDGSVGEKNWADLAEFSQFIAVSANDIPRFCMNRMEAGANHNDTKAEAKFVDINALNPSWWEVDDYLTIDEGKYSVDLKKVVDDYGVARLHCIKGKAYQVKTTLTDMLLYRTITVGDAGYATFGSVSKNAKPNGVKAYAAQYNGSYLTLTEVENVPAGKGVIIEAAKGSYAPTFDVAAADIESDLLVSNGTIVGDGSTIYVLANKEKGVGFYKLKDGEKVPAGKAYLKTDEIAAPEFLGFGADVTGINEVKAVEAKGEFFNLAGQRVAQPAKGLYIANGKKVIIK